MRSDLTDITVVLDRSGSMVAIQKDAQGGLNSFIDEQKKQPGSALFTLVQFDTEYEFIHKGADLKTVGHHTLVPRGGTALLDAVGKAVVETGERLKAMLEADRPGLVVCVIITDGGENSSKEYKRAQIKEMIEKQQSVYKWQFIFIGANQDAFAEAGAMGINLVGAANYTNATAKQAYQETSSNVMRMRRAAASGEVVCAAFTPEERSEMSGGK